MRADISPLQPVVTSIICGLVVRVAYEILGFRNCCGLMVCIALCCLVAYRESLKRFLRREPEPELRLNGTQIGNQPADCIQKWRPFNLDSLPPPGCQRASNAHSAGVRVSFASPAQRAARWPRRPPSMNGAIDFRFVEIGRYPCENSRQCFPLEDTLAQNLPYLPSNKNVGKLFEKILTAQKPETFTHEYLRDTIGLKGTNDRPLISFLRALGFLDTANRPTTSYDLLKNPAKARGAIAAGVKTAYGPLFKANEKSNELPSDDLKGLIAQVTGSDKDMVDRIAATFSAIVKQGDFAAGSVLPEDLQEEDADQPSDEKKSGDKGGLRPEFHYNFQIHLPGNGTEETYLNIFNALRRTFR